MTAWLVAVAVVVAAGAVAALVVGEPRLALVGLAVSLLGATLLADPLPSPATLGVRLVAALLAVASLWAVAPPVGARLGAEPDPDAGPRLGWPALLLLGAAGGTAGLSLLAGLPEFVSIVIGGSDLTGIGRGTFLDASGLAVVLATGLASAAIPVAVLDPRPVRRAVAALLLVQAAVLLRAGLAGPPGVVEEVVLGALLVATAGGGALLAGALIGRVAGDARQS